MAQTVYDRIRAAIIAGEFEPGIGISETALAEMYGTSRTPVREAVHRLENERLVERTRRGVFVHQVEPAEILDIYDVLTTLEAHAARMAAERATDWDRVRLRSAHQAMAGYDGTIARTRADLNREFHEVLWSATHSRTTIDVLRQLNSHLVIQARTTLSVAARWRAANDEHEALIAAIEARDGEAASRIAADHMIAAREVRVRLYTDPDGAAADS